MMENMTENSMMARQERPLGVMIMAILLGIQGLLELIGGIILIFAANSLSHRIISHGHTIIAKLVDTFGVALGATSIIVGIITLLFVFGLWTLKRWAYWAVIIIEVLSLLPNIFALVRHTGSIVGILIQMIFPIVILLYFLMDSTVRNAFRI